MNVTSGKRGERTCKLLANNRDLSWEKVLSKKPTGNFMVSRIDNQQEICILDPETRETYIYLWEDPDRRWAYLCTGCIVPTE